MSLWLEVPAKKKLLPFLGKTAFALSFMRL